MPKDAGHKACGGTTRTPPLLLPRTVVFWCKAGTFWCRLWSEAQQCGIHMPETVSIICTQDALIKLTPPVAIDLMIKPHISAVVITGELSELWCDFKLHLISNFAITAQPIGILNTSFSLATVYLCIYHNLQKLIKQAHKPAAELERMRAC